ncbi:MAG: hypothetical protein ACJ74H_15870 [Thermoanaerobaculia bacterium]
MRFLVLVLALFAAMSSSAAVITVTGTTNDVASDGVCTILEAIHAANTNAAVNECAAGSPGLDTIAFNVGGGGPQTIAVSSSLFDITEPVFIDGATQPGFAGSPLITILATVVNTPWCIVISESAGGSTVRALAIGGFQVGINLRSSDNIVVGNYLGLHSDGVTRIANAIGVYVTRFGAIPVSGNRIGGPAAADRNVFGGHSSTGVVLDSAPAASLVGGDNVIQGNIIGLDAAANAVVGLNGSAITIHKGTGTRIVDNLIGGNVAGGIGVSDSSATVIQGNTIGGPGIGNGSFGPAAVGIHDSTGTIVGATTSGAAGERNTIAFNLNGGVNVASGRGNSILTNSIHDNGGLGIDLSPIGPQPNDPCDADTGPNDRQNRPVLTRAIASGGTTTIFGTLNSTASSPFTLELFSNATADAEGETYLDTITVNTDATCNATFTATVAVAPNLSVTATATESERNTSEFSAPVIVREALLVTKAFDPAAIDLRVPSSTLTITIHNPNNSPETGLTFTDTYPSGMTNTQPAASNCGGTVNGAVGAGFVHLTGGTLAAGATCTVTAFVTVSEAGSYVNTLPAGTVTTPGTQNLAPATATLTAGEGIPVLSRELLLLVAAILAMAGMMKLRLS